MDLTVLGVSTRAIVYFFEDPAIHKNVLGRTGWLDCVRVGLIHHDGKVYLAPHGSD